MAAGSSSCRFWDLDSRHHVDVSISSRGCAFKGHVISELVGVERRLGELVRLVSTRKKRFSMVVLMT